MNRTNIPPKTKRIKIIENHKDFIEKYISKAIVMVIEINIIIIDKGWVDIKKKIEMMIEILISENSIRINM